MSPAQIAAIERATVAGVAPAEVLEIGGWLVPLDAGAIGRAKSAVPLSHQAAPDAVLAVEAAYRDRGLPPAFRIADVAGLQTVRAALKAAGFSPAKPTAVETVDAAALAAFSASPAELLDRPDGTWGGVFAGEGFDPVEGASRVAALARAPDAFYGCIRAGGEPVAVGVCTFGHGWAGVHGLRTAQSYRGRGHAGALLAAFARAAQARGVSRVFLQVEAENPARRLYRRAGFTEAWAYRYWTRA